jgi:hypothetical protein
MTWKILDSFFEKLENFSNFAVFRTVGAFP